MEVLVCASASACECQHVLIHNAHLVRPGRTIIGISHQMLYVRETASLLLSSLEGITSICASCIQDPQKYISYTKFRCHMCRVCCDMGLAG
jgi:hypothetical protein